MEPVKQKISVTLDADLLAELRQQPGSVSSQLNEALREEVMRRRRSRGLQSFLAELEATEGPLDTPEDLADMARIEELWRSIEDPAQDQRAS